MKNYRNIHQLFRGVLQSEDGLISEIIKGDDKFVVFKAIFKAKRHFLDQYEKNPEHFIFSERSRIARLGVQITIAEGSSSNNNKDSIILTLKASSVISGYPSFNKLKDFFCKGFPVGRIVFCDPESMLASDEVIDALNKAELKLPKLTSISSDGSIVISPHKSLYFLKENVDKEILGRILMWKEGRSILNLYQYEQSVSSITIPSGDGIITSCSMYLNEHFVVLHSSSDLGKQLPATVLDPIKTRGVRIFLEIVNDTDQPIVNPLIRAKVYKVRKIFSLRLKNQSVYIKVIPFSRLMK